MPGKLTELVSQHHSSQFERMTNESQLKFLYRQMREEIASDRTNWETVRAYILEIEKLESK